MEARWRAALSPEFECDIRSLEMRERVFALCACVVVGRRRRHRQRFHVHCELRSIKAVAAAVAITGTQTQFETQQQHRFSIVIIMKACCHHHYCTIIVIGIIIAIIIPCSESTLFSQNLGHNHRLSAEQPAQMYTKRFSPVVHAARCFFDGMICVQPIRYRSRRDNAQQAAQQKPS